MKRLAAKRAARLRVATRDDKEAGGGDGEEAEVEETPGEVADAEEVHGGQFDEVGAGHVHVADVAVGRPSALDEEADVMHERGVTNEWPAPTEKEECGARRR